MRRISVKLKNVLLFPQHNEVIIFLVRLHYISAGSGKQVQRYLLPVCLTVLRDSKSSLINRLAICTVTFSSLRFNVWYEIKD